MPPSLRERLVQELAGRTRLPRGEASRIAREFDCTRERIRQLLVVLGVTIEPPKRARCEQCEKPISRNKGGICIACLLDRNRVMLVCVRCGKIFHRPRKWHNEFLNRVIVRRRYGPICSKSCLLRNERKCSWCGEPAGWRRPSANSGLAFCSLLGRPCHVQALKAMPPAQWHRLTPDLLPMAENREAIARLITRLR